MIDTINPVFEPILQGELESPEINSSRIEIYLHAGNIVDYIMTSTENMILVVKSTDIIMFSSQKTYNFAISLIKHNISVYAVDKLFKNPEEILLDLLVY